MTVAPKKSLGQHFLVDENILGVIGRLSELGSDDVVLEVGPGLGVLTRYLADRARVVHAIELDRSLEPALRDALGERSNVEFIWGDALDSRRRQAAAGTEQARGQPPVQRRHAARRRDAGAREVAGALVRHGAARGRRAVLRTATDEGVRCGVRARSALGTEDRLPSRASDRVSATPSCRVRARRLRARDDRPDRRGQARRGGVLRAQAQDARATPSPSRVSVRAPGWRTH